MKAVSPDRWQASQRLELDFWKHWTEAAAYQNLDIPKYWDEELRRFNCTGEIFSGRRVLDIGCGPFGLIHYLEMPGNGFASIRCCHSMRPGCR